MPLSVEDDFKTHKGFLIAGGIVASVFLLALGIVTVQKIRVDPDTVFLFSEQGADWIRLQKPVDLAARISARPRNYLGLFRIKFTVGEVPPRALLKIRAMKLAGVFLDKRLIYVTGKKPGDWKRTRSIDLAPGLTAGSHELYIKVLNQNGPPALLAYCQALNIFSGEGWDASEDGQHWTPAWPVNRNQSVPISRKFQRTDRALFLKLPLFLAIIILFIIYSRLKDHRDRLNWIDGMIPKAKTTRWLLLGLWVILVINNLTKIPADMGMDYDKHWEYIRYVVENWRIPSAREGWQMFESPLFYLVSAGVYKVCSIFFSVGTSERVVGIIPAAFAAAQVELSFRALRYVFPKREDLQSLGTILGGLLPMNLYMSQSIGTEPMAGFFTAFVLVLLFRHLYNPLKRPAGIYLLMGLSLGLAILTKITAVLIIPPLVFFLAYSIPAGMDRPNRTAGYVFRRIMLVLIVSLLVSGWYYITNWIETGRFFVMGTDISRGIVWWQDPGFRTPGQFFRFGGSLFYPIFSGLTGIWDSLYSTMWMDGFLSGIIVFSVRPPWNYGFMLSGAWLSLLPSTAILVGISAALKNPGAALRKGSLLAASCAVIYVTAILYMYLTLPIYSIGKASYMLGLIPCFAVLFSSGFDMIAKRPFVRAFLSGIMICWALSAYCAYFII